MTARSNEKRYVLGKVDYSGSGRRNCEAAITWSLVSGRFSMQAEVCYSRKSDLYMGGQCVDTVAAMFPHDALAQRMCAIWKRWHLNDMRAGSPLQEAYLRDHPIPEGGYQYPLSYYDAACKVLASVGLNPDPDGYTYGHAWKHEDLPADVVAEIESWGSR